MKKRKFCMKGKVICFLGTLVLLFMTVPAQAMVYDFNGGTNQGWTVLFNYQPSGSEAPAGWNTNTNFSGNVAEGRPPVYGPLDTTGDLTGAIFASGSVPSTSSFSSPSFSGEAMDSISAYFIVSGMEHGISREVDVRGIIGYQKEGSDEYYFGWWIPLATELVAGEPYAYPLWTPVSVNVADGDLVRRIIVNIDVDDTLIEGGTQNWVDQVVTRGDSGNGNGNGGSVPEPMTILLYGLGFGGAGIYRRLRKKK